MEKEENKNNNFVFSAIHKLKTPASSVKLATEMLLDGDFGELNLEQKKIIERTYQKNNSLIVLINDLLNLAKVKAKKHQNLKLRRVDLAELIDYVVDCKKEEISKKGITVRIEKPDSATFKIRLDKEKVFLAVQNIFDNAVKYGKIGGQVDIFFGVNNKKLEIKIKDNGIGIPEEDKDKLFTEFFRSDNAKELDPMGSGLGLYITKSAVESHGGKVWFESEEGKGSTFYITLPVK